MIGTDSRKSFNFPVTIANKPAHIEGRSSHSPLGWAQNHTGGGVSHPECSTSKEVGHLGMASV